MPAREASNLGGNLVEMRFSAVTIMGEIMSALNGSLISGMTLRLIGLVALSVVAVVAAEPADAEHCKGQHRNDPGCDAGGTTLRDQSRQRTIERTQGEGQELRRDVRHAGTNAKVPRRVAFLLFSGHADLGTTERYVETSLEAQRRLISLT